ncbi:MAG: glycosyltransferase [Caulobacteraceae bacterium]
MRISVVIPALDEGARIGALVAALRSQGFDDIVVADGGSRDETHAEARAAGAVLVTSARGLGRGALLRSRGFQASA